MWYPIHQKGSLMKKRYPLWIHEEIYKFKVRLSFIWKFISLEISQSLKLGLICLILIEFEFIGLLIQFFQD